MTRLQDGLSRRGFCLCCLAAPGLAATGAWLTPRQAYAAARDIVDQIRSAAATTPIAIHRLRGDIAVLEGSGGNVAVLIGRQGKVMVDAGIAVSRPQMEIALASLGAAPVTQLINTHWHFDHANGNSWLHELGPEIIAHEKTPRHLSVTERVADWDYDFPPLPAVALPTTLFARKHVLRRNDTTIALQYYGPAHTDCDISVRFVEPDILHTGDTYWNGVYPFIDLSTGGSIDGSIRAAEANLAMTSATTIVIPGHGAPVSDRAGLLAFRDMLVGIRANVVALKQRGLSLEQVVAARPTAAYDAVWGGFVIGPDLFTRVAYESL